MEITEHMEEDTETGIEGAGSELEQVLDDGVLTFQFPTRTSGKVAIVGFAGGHHYQAPFKDTSVETWGINRLWVELPDRRWTRWFELHDLGLFYRDDEDHKQFLRNFEGPVYVREQDYALALEWGIDTAVPFPHRILTEQFQPYFTNTISWLLALAILMDFEHIGIYGVDMAVDNVMQAEYCVAPDTRVLTDTLEWVPASTVKPGDRLIGFDELPQNGNRYREYKGSVVLSVKELMRPSYRLEMADGTKLVSSQEHRWLTNMGNQMQWATTDRLHAPLVTEEIAEQIRAEWGPYEKNQRSTRGVSHRDLSRRYGIDRSAVQRILAGTYDFDRTRRNNIVKLTDTWDTDRTRGAGYLAAAFDGEGHLSMNPRGSGQNGTSVSLGFAQRPNAMAAEVNRELHRRGFAYTQANRDDCHHWNVRGGRSEILRFLGTIRPHRLLDVFDPDRLGIVHSSRNVDIVGKEYLGEQPVVAITTETGTFIAEGFASHNSDQRPSCEYFLGIAHGRGIQTFIPYGSDLLKASHLYGYEDSGPVLMKMAARFQELGRAKESLRAQAQQLHAQANTLEGQLSQLDGAMQEVAYWKKNWLINTTYQVEVE